MGTSYVRYYNKKYKTSGHLWQGRYKSFIVQRDSYLLTLIKYVEANPLRAKIVTDASAYKYSSIHSRLSCYNNGLVDKVPIDLPLQWLDFVNDKEKETDIDMIRNSIERQAPLGDEVWQVNISKTYGLDSTLKSRGRPRLK